MATSNQTSRKRDRDDRVDFEYTGRVPIPKDVAHVSFHPSVTEVHKDAFNNCTNLREVVLNEGLKEIRRGGFCHINCKSLERITFSSTVTEIGQISFSSCRSLKEVVLNEGLKKIGTKAFHHCSSLQSITLPSTLTNTGVTVFAFCTNLRRVVLNEGLKTINGCAFYGCKSLERISLPSTLDEIGSLAFSSCTNLRVVELYGIVQKIGEDAFANCQSLEKFTFPSLSTRLENIIQTGHWSEEVEGKFDEIRGLVQRRGSEIFVSAADMRTRGGGNNWDSNSWNCFGDTHIKDYVDRINELIAYYEKKETASLFELALWKFRISQTEANDDINRDACRIDVPGPVKDAILQYL